MSHDLTESKLFNEEDKRLRVGRRPKIRKEFEFLKEKRSKFFKDKTKNFLFMQEHCERCGSFEKSPEMEKWQLCTSCAKDILKEKSREARISKLF